MAAKKTTKKSEVKVISNTKSVGLKLSSVNLNFIKNNFRRAIALHNVSSVLAIVYYLIWIPIGAFLLWFVFANFKAGVFDQLMGAQNANGQNPQVQTEQPTETTVPGIGRVNIDCVQNSVSEDTIVKMVQEKSMQNLTDEEKQKLEPCILEKDTTSPSPEASAEQSE